MSAYIKDGVGTLDMYLNAIGSEGTADSLSPEILAGMIDHTALKPETTQSEIEILCKEAMDYNFKSVCVNPYWIPLCAQMLKDSASLVCTVIGFPLGANSLKLKVFETEDAISSGADEVDMVLNVGAVKSGDYTSAENDIAAVVKTATGNALVKVILETCLLTPEEIEKASKISMNAGAHYVKTSTGFSSGGATKEAISIMRKTVGENLGVKASGGVRDLAGATAMLKAGATRIGASAGIAIIKGLKSDSDY
jgi:deoxyribose-phosphate aldolase